MKRRLIIGGIEIMNRKERFTLMCGTSGGAAGGVSGGLASAMNLSPGNAVITALVVGVIVGVIVSVAFRLLLPSQSEKRELD
jgi:hypothetical protein